MIESENRRILENSHALLSAFSTACHSPVVRTMRQWAEDEIILPNGPYAGEPYSTDNQPYARLWFDEVDSGRWRQHWAVGPTQSGKTLTCSIIPLGYHLFEIGETVIFALPDMDMAKDKWELDILPVIKRTRYAAMLPKKGLGSRGGKFTSITFSNGATLRFMSAGGRDKSRSAYTARVLIVTEVEAFGEVSGDSEESDKLEQLLGRLLSDPDNARVFGECTTTVKKGLIWQKYTGGSESRIALPCPHCGGLVTPELESITGWEEAKNELDAEEGAAWHCPACGKMWTEEDRRAANLAAVLIHKGQSFGEDGQPQGDAPRTHNLGFRWSAVNNMFWKSGTVGLQLWNAAHARDEELAKRKICQFIFAKPYVPPDLDIEPLCFDVLKNRKGVYDRGIIPADVQALTMGIDIGLHFSHWVLLAGCSEKHPHAPDYGSFDMPSKEYNPDDAILNGLRRFRDDVIEQGWTCETGTIYTPQEIWIDARYKPDAVIKFCMESGPKYRPCYSFSTVSYSPDSRYKRLYHAPKRTNKTILHASSGYHIEWDADAAIHKVIRDADYWKSWIHDRLRTDPNSPGGMSLYHSREKRAHAEFFKSILSEKEVDVMIQGRGLVRRWEVVEQRKSHLFDSAGEAAAALDFCGWKIIEDDIPSEPVMKKNENQSKGILPAVNAGGRFVTGWKR